VLLLRLSRALVYTIVNAHVIVTCLFQLCIKLHDELVDYRILLICIGIIIIIITIIITVIFIGLVILATRLSKSQLLHTSGTNYHDTPRLHCPR